MQMWQIYEFANAMTAQYGLHREVRASARCRLAVCVLAFVFCVSALAHTNLRAFLCTSACIHAFVLTKLVTNPTGTAACGGPQAHEVG